MVRWLATLIPFQFLCYVITYRFQGVGHRCYLRGYCSAYRNEGPEFKPKSVWLLDVLLTLHLYAHIVGEPRLGVREWRAGGIVWEGLFRALQARSGPLNSLFNTSCSENTKLWTGRGLSLILDWLLFLYLGQLSTPWILLAGIVIHSADKQPVEMCATG